MTLPGPREATALTLLGVAAALGLWWASGPLSKGPLGANALAVAAVLAGVVLAAGAPLVPVTRLAGLGRPWIEALVPVSVAGALSWPTLDAYFLGDDFGYVQLFHRTPWAAALYTGDISRGIWGVPLDEFRPLGALVFALGVFAHGTNAVSWHLGSLGLHAIVTLLVVRVARSVGLPTAVPMLAGALFAVAPANAETIAWISGRVDLLSSLLYVSTVLAFWRFRRMDSLGSYALALFAFGAGLLCKEILLTLPLILLASDLLLDRRVRITEGRSLLRLFPVHAPFAFVTLLYLVVRHASVGGVARANLLRTRILERVADLGGHLGYLLVPFEPLVRARPPDFSTAFLVAVILLGEAALLVLLARAPVPRARALVVFFGVLWPAITFLPLLVTYFSPRHLYLPLVGVVVALAIVLLPPEGNGVRLGVVRLGLASLVLSVHGYSLFQSQRRWAEAGRVSRALQQGLSNAIADLPTGTLVVLARIPSFGRDNRTALWNVALPFALQPPFLASDVYDRYRVLESPDIYCCPPAVWWEHKKGFLAALVSGPPESDSEITVLHWNRHRGTVVRHRAAVSRAVLRRAVERVLRAPFEEARGVTYSEASQILQALDVEARFAAGHSSLQ